MPFSSADIAAATGAFVQQHAANLQYSQMIGTGGFQPAMSDALSGSMMSRGMAVAGPLASGAMGMIGLDPMSLGMKAGMGILGRGGSLLTAGMAGLGVAGGASLGMYAAQKAGEQMMMGAQQQQQLNTSLRQNFNFMTPNGQGFNRSDMTQIGSQLRAMTHQTGPGGEVVSMNELVQLAGNMGRMGMAGGVRDAQEFGRKFREMVSTLKTVAQELGTSLQEAQQFMMAQKNSGIFRFSDQAKFATQARGTAMAGGLALSEVTSMASIGSQISRSVGGLGRSGAFGGMRTIGQIGSAMQVGALSEEDVYNATGLTGAEGRQALATDMMSRSASFLKSGRGRYLLASMAGKDGNLDEASAMSWAMGGMDVGETKAMAGRNLAGVGRANFIRNEGRLRGAVLERFGGMAQTMAYSQWLGSRGYDPTSMDDRSMLAFQRFSGLGRDEADAAIKMVQRMPEIMQDQKNKMADDRYEQSLGTYRKTHGVEGAKRALEKLRENIQGKIQGVGQDLYNSATDMVESLFNKALGVTERRVSDNINELWAAAKMGGKGGAAAMAQLTGGGALAQFAGPGGKAGLMGGVGMQEWMKNQSMKLSAETAQFGSTAEIDAFASSNRNAFREAYAGGLAGKGGEERIKAFGTLLQQRAAGGDAAARQMLSTWNNSGDVARSGMVAAAENKLGVGGEAGLAKNFSSKELGFLSGEFSTIRQGDIATGRQLLGRSTEDSAATTRGARAGSVALSAMFGGALTTAATGAAVYDKVTGSHTTKSVLAAPEAFSRAAYGRLTGSDEFEAAAGAVLRTGEGGQLAMGALSGSTEGRENIQNKLMDLQARQGRGETLGHDDQGRMALYKNMLMASSYSAYKGGKIGADEAAKQILSQSGGGMSALNALSNARESYQALGSTMYKQQIGNANEIIRRQTQEAYANFKAGTTQGTYEMNKEGKFTLSAKTKADLEKHGFGYIGKTAESIMEAQQGMTGDFEKDRATLAQLYGEGGAVNSQYEDIARMSIAQKRQLARDTGGLGIGEVASASIARERRLRSASRGRGVTAGIATTLGLDLSKDDLATMKGMDAEHAAAFMANKIGTNDTMFQKQLTEAITAGKSGKMGLAADLAARGVAQSEDAKKKIMEAQRSKDPQAQMVDAIKEGNQFLRALVDSNKDATAALKAIQGNTAESKNAEGESK